MGCYASANLI
jgi:hypothetical protein